MITVKKNEATAALRRVEFHCVDATDGMTPETGEAGGQPQIAYPGAETFSNTGIGVLVANGNGRYYAELDQATCNIADRSLIKSRYKSANTAEALGTTVQIVEFPVDASVAAPLKIIQAAVAGKTTGSPTSTVKFRDEADTKDVITVTLDLNGNRTVVTVDGT